MFQYLNLKVSLFSCGIMLVLLWFLQLANPIPPERRKKEKMTEGKFSPLFGGARKKESRVFFPKKRGRHKKIGLTFFFFRGPYSSFGKLATQETKEEEEEGKMGDWRLSRKLQHRNGGGKERKGLLERRKVQTLFFWSLGTHFSAKTETQQIKRH